MARRAKADKDAIPQFHRVVAENDGRLTSVFWWTLRGEAVSTVTPDEVEAWHRSEALRLIARPANDATKAKAKKEFEVVVEVVKEVCRIYKIDPHPSEPCAKRVRRFAGAILRARGIARPGIGRLSRALGRIRRERYIRK